MNRRELPQSEKGYLKQRNQKTVVNIILSGEKLGVSPLSLGKAKYVHRLFLFLFSITEEILASAL